MDWFAWVILLTKTEPWWLIFGFLAQTSPRRLAKSHPSPSNTMYPTPMESPIPKIQPTCISLAKTKPWQLGFQFFDPNWPPARASLNHTPFPPHTWCTPPQWGLLYPKKLPSHLAFMKTDPTHLLPPPPFFFLICLSINRFINNVLRLKI